jgi:hypothetical protein
VGVGAVTELVWAEAAAAAAAGVGVGAVMELAWAWAVAAAGLFHRCTTTIAPSRGTTLRRLLAGREPVLVRALKLARRVISISISLSANARLRSLIHHRLSNHVVSFHATLRAHARTHARTHTQTAEAVARTAG